MAVTISGVTQQLGAFTLTGNGFVSPASSNTVTIGGVSCTPLSEAGGTTLIASYPIPGASAGNIVVVNSNGTSNAFASGTLVTVGGSLGALDTGGQWMSGNANDGSYMGQNGTPTTLRGFMYAAIAGILSSGYPGMTWLKNVFALPRTFWPPTLGDPNSGQVYPKSGSASAPGQVTPN